MRSMTRTDQNRCYILRTWTGNRWDPTHVSASLQQLLDDMARADRLSMRARQIVQILPGGRLATVARGQHPLPIQDRTRRRDDGRSWRLIIAASVCLWAVIIGSLWLVFGR